MFKNLCNEIWRDIENYPGYQVSNYGRVRSLNYNHTGQVRVLKPDKDIGNYLRVVLCKNGKSRHYKVHRLVAIAFIPNPLNLPCINHKDCSRQNNFVWINPDGSVDSERSNLEWCDYSYNNNYADRNEKISKWRTNNPHLSKPVAQYALNGDLVATYPSAHEAARQTGFFRQSINSCCNKRKHHNTAYGYIWKYI